MLNLGYYRCQFIKFINEICFCFDFCLIIYTSTYLVRACTYSIMGYIAIHLFFLSQFSKIIVYLVSRLTVMTCYFCKLVVSVIRLTSCSPILWIFRCWIKTNIFTMLEVWQWWAVKCDRFSDVSVNYFLFSDTFITSNANCVQVLVLF